MMDINELKKYFYQKNILIIGGMGFLGSNVAHILVELGAIVTVLSRSNRNIENLKGIENKVTCVFGDFNDEKLIGRIIKNQDYIFNFAAQVSYLKSIEFPIEDLEANCRGHLILLEALRKIESKAHVLFSSSRLVYGKITAQKVSEEHITDPLSIYGAHKLVAEKYYSLYHKLHNLNTVIVRIPNPYGPRQSTADPQNGAIVGWILNEMMQGRKVKIFGDGLQKRSYIYIDDLVSAMLQLVANKEAIKGEVFNIGTDEVLTFKEMVQTIHEVVKKGSYKNVPWPKDYEKNETGDYIPDLSKLKKYTSFQAEIPLRLGITKMLEYMENTSIKDQRNE